MNEENIYNDEDSLSDNEILEQFARNIYDTIRKPGVLIPNIDNLNNLNL